MPISPGLSREDIDINKTGTDPKIRTLQTDGKYR